MTSYTDTIAKRTEYVKTTISVPSDVFARATRRAKELGTSRSALFSDAVEKELDATNSSADLIARINAVLDSVADDTVEFTTAAARRLLSSDDTTW